MIHNSITFLVAMLILYCRECLVPERPGVLVWPGDLWLGVITQLTRREEGGGMAGGKTEELMLNLVNTLLIDIT